MFSTFNADEFKNTYTKNQLASLLGYHIKFKIQHRHKGKM